MNCRQQALFLAAETLRQGKFPPPRSSSANFALYKCGSSPARNPRARSKGSASFPAHLPCPKAFFRRKTPQPLCSRSYCLTIGVRFLGYDTLCSPLCIDVLCIQTSVEHPVKAKRSVVFLQHVLSLLQNPAEQRLCRVQLPLVNQFNGILQRTAQCTKKQFFFCHLPLSPFQINVPILFTSFGKIQQILSTGQKDFSFFMHSNEILTYTAKSCQLLLLERTMFHGSTLPVFSATPALRV